MAPSGVETAISTLYASAEAAGFFEARAGSRTQLIIPQVGRTPPPDQRHPPGGEHGGGGGSDEPPHDERQHRTASDLKNDYVSTLIAVLREQGKNGALDQELMLRIEKLLDLPQ